MDQRPRDQTAKITLVLVAAVLLAPLEALHTADAPKPTAKRNIILSLIDLLGWRDL